MGRSSGRIFNDTADGEIHVLAKLCHNSVKALYLATYLASSLAHRPVGGFDNPVMSTRYHASRVKDLGPLVNVLGPLDDLGYHGASPISG